MIRLGTLAGYSFEGPRVLAGWRPPAQPGVYAILYRPDPTREQFAVIYAGHADDLSRAGFPFHHPAAACWIRRAGSRWRVHIATLEIPGGLAGHREQVVAELLATYRPGCNAERLEHSWDPDWIVPPSSLGSQPGQDGR